MSVEQKKNSVAWAAIILTILSYAAATAATIASQGTRISSLEESRSQDRMERRQVMDKLDGITERVTAIQTEQRITARASK